MSSGIVIIGGGPAGSAAAIHLARAGMRATLLERGAEVGDALCGGFLSWRTLERLAGLGLDIDALGGHPIKRMAIFVADAEHEAILPAPALGLSRRRLDGALLALAGKDGADIRMASGVRAADGRKLHLDNGEAVEAETLFLATGKHDLRGLVRDTGSAAAPGRRWLGLRLRLPHSPARARLLAGRIDLHLFEGGYAGLMLQEDGSANFCLAVTKRRLAAAGGRPDALVRRLAESSPALAERLEGLGSEGVQVDAIGHIPYGWRARTTRPGIFRLGDQAGVIPSFAGEGIGIALASAEAAVSAWRQGGAGAALRYQQRMAADLRRPIGIARLVTAVTGRPGLARRMLPLAMRSPLPRWLAVATRVA